MGRSHRCFYFWGALLLILGAGSCQAEVKDTCHSLSIGVLYVGGQIHKGLGDRWAAEIRGQTGDASSTLGTVHANAVGLRLYRYFNLPSRRRLFLGTEGALTGSKSERGDYRTKGAALGAFAGAELYAARRVSFSLDAGPYFFATKVKNSGLTQSGMEFVISTSMNFYLL